MMKFGEVPEQAKTARPWATTRTIDPPPGREDRIGSLEAQIDDQTDLGRVYRTFVYLEPGDLEELQAGRPIELGVNGDFLWPMSVRIS